MRVDVSKYLDLGKTSMDFSRVERAPFYPDSRRESDVEHSFMLALLAQEFAAELYPELSLGRIAQFAVVHDLVEVITGDVRTVIISEEELIKKAESERQALEVLRGTLPPVIFGILEDYERQVEPEARFVRFVDKIAPKIVNYCSGLGLDNMKEHGVGSASELNELRIAQGEKLSAQFPEFLKLMPYFEEISRVATEKIFGSSA